MVKLKDLLLERIVLDIKPGDVILGGRFKNKKIVVKSIGKDEHGMPTINGRKVVNFRIAPKTEVNERVDFHDTAKQIVNKAGLKSKIVFAKRAGNKADYNVDTDTIYITPTSDFKDFLVTVFHEIDHAIDAKKFGKKKYKQRYEMEMNKAVERGGDAHDDNYFEKKAEKYGRKMAKDYLGINRKNIYK
jgi:antirestriction protein ArdC